MLRVWLGCSAVPLVRLIVIVLWEVVLAVSVVVLLLMVPVSDLLMNVNPRGSWSWILRFVAAAAPLFVMIRR